MPTAWKALDTPAKIYFNQSVSPVGSHKTNTAIPQAYYNYKQGIRHLTTETGAGQWVGRDVNGYAALRHRPGKSSWSR